MQHNTSNLTVLTLHSGYNHSTMDGVDMYSVYEDIIYSYIILTICVFGIVGNLINIIILHTTRTGHGAVTSRMEQSAQFGLIALSVSDLLFCVCTAPSSFCYKEKSASSGTDVRLLYWAYSDAVINTFIMSSTWLTVMMAASRYLAISHPFKARRIIGMKFTRICTCCILVFCILLTMPRYFFWRIEHVEWGGSVVWFTMPGPMKQLAKAETIYSWLYFIIGIILPLVILTFSNMKLLQTLAGHQDSMIRCHHQQQQTSHHYRVTLTLVIIVIVYTLCLVPAEIANFIKYLEIVVDNTNVLNFVIAVLNASQAGNFAFNFVLYCSLNKEFRRTLVHLITPCCGGKSRLNRHLSSMRSNGRDTGITDMELTPLDTGEKYCNKEIIIITK